MAVVVLGIGALAVARLQIVARHGVQDAAQRTLAARLAQEMLDRMRANNAMPALAAYVGGASPWPARWAGRSRLGGSSDPGGGCAPATPCTGLRRAELDLRDWEAGLDGLSERVGEVAVGGLLYPTACVNGPTDGRSGRYTVTIAWRGHAPLPGRPAPDCGREAASAGVLLYGEDDRYLRQLTITTYIAARA